MLIPFNQLFDRHQVKPRGILHIGANSGQEAEMYASLNIRRVIWIEALPDVFLRLKEHLRAFPSHIALEACVSDTNDQEVIFHVASNEGQSSSLLEPTQHKVEHPSVKFDKRISLRTVRVDTLLEEQGLDMFITGDWLLNIDLQGAELLALKGMGDLLNHFQWAYLEVNYKELYKGCPLVEDIDAFLAEHGFQGRETCWTGSGWGDKFYSK